MKTISTKLDEETVKVLEEKAQQQNMTVSEYLRQQIYPLIEGTKPLSFEQCLAKLASCLSRLYFCVKPLQDLAFDLQEFETRIIVKADADGELILKQEKEKAQDVQPENKPETQPEFEKAPIEEEKKPDEQTELIVKQEMEKKTDAQETSQC